MNEILKQIINAAIRAPSGDNSQPWKFGVTKNGLNLYLLTERDNSLYNFNQLASLISHGAAIENITVAARKFGLEHKIELFPSPQNPNLVAKITFEPGGNDKEPLYSHIFSRCTNRKPYKKIKLRPEQLNDLLVFVQEQGLGKIVFIDDPKKIHELATIASSNEKILFENFHLHKFFFEHIIWSPVNKNNIGFYIKTLEVPAAAMPVFKLAKNWKTLQWLNKIGFSSMIAKANAKTYSSCSVIGALFIENNESRNYVLAGRLMQKVWLKSCSMNLSFQLLAGIPCLFQRVEAKNGRELLNDEQIELIKKSYKKAQSLFETENETIALMFRMGEDGEPSAKTSRAQAEIFQDS